MSRVWRYALILGYPLLAPSLLVGLLYALVIARAHSWQFREGVLTAIAGTRTVTEKRRDGVLVKRVRTRLWFEPGAQGWSPLVLYASEEKRAEQDLRVHENGHVAQEIAWALVGAAVGGVLFPIVGVEPGLIATFSGGPAFSATYLGNFVVGWARRFPGFYRRFRAEGMSAWQAWRHAGGMWTDAYRAILYERQAYARQAAYLALPPTKQVEVWGHRS